MLRILSGFHEKLGLHNPGEDFQAALEGEIQEIASLLQAEIEKVRAISKLHYSMRKALT
jgi:hypothetical protein